MRLEHAFQLMTYQQPDRVHLQHVMAGQREREVLAAESDQELKRLIA